MANPAAGIPENEAPEGAVLDPAAGDHASQIVEARLEHAGELEGLTATVEDHAGEAHPAELSALGLTTGMWAALAMIVFIGILLWKKVPALITGGLDSKISEIKQQLDEAKKLRAEAEALRKEYADKIAGAEKDAAAMLEHAKFEAEAIVEKAEVDTTAMIARRKQMAEDRIAGAERGVMEELRAKAAEAAAQAAGVLIAEKHDAAADSKLVDEEISSL